MTSPSDREISEEIASEDRDELWGEHPNHDDHENWLREQRPPHWG